MCTSHSLVHGSHSPGGSNVPHPQSTSFKCAIAHNGEELCSLFNHGLSGDPDEDETNEGDDLMVGDVEGGDDPGANGIMAPPLAAVASRTAGAKAWVSAPFGI